MPVEWRGADQVDDALDNGLRMSADALLDNTKPRVPVDSTDLRESGTTAIDGDTAAVGFGSGDSAEYAQIQHQRRKYTHDEGEAGFLKNAVDDFGPEFEQILGEQVRRVIGG